VTGATIETRNSAITEGTRQLKSCQLLHNCMKEITFAVRS